MPKKKANKDKEPKIKQKNIFDHLEDIMVNKKSDYYDGLNEKEKKDYSVYMIQRFLSMVPKYIEVINEINPYIYNLTNEQYHKMMVSVIPQGKVFIQYIKKSGKDNKVGLDWVVDCLMKLFLVSEQEAVDYKGILNKDSVIELGRMFGIDKKEIKRSIRGLN